MALTTIIILIVIIVFSLFLLGPRVPVDPHIRTFEIPNLEELDNYLRLSEQCFADIIPGTEKTVIWADPANKQKTPVSIVYIHGFSASRQETAPLSERIAKELGANLFYTRLTGHGRGGTAMAEASVNDWLNDAVEALEIGRRIGEKVLVIATSTGATLATWLATYGPSEEVVGYVLISPNYMPSKTEAWILTWPWAKYLVPLVFGKIWHWTPVNELHGYYWAQDYPITANMTLMALVRFVRRLDFTRIQHPVLVLLSPNDKIVKPAHTEKFYTRLGSSIKQKVYIEDSQDPREHVIAGDILSPNTTNRLAGIIVEFVKPLM